MMLFTELAPWQQKILGALHRLHDAEKAMRDAKEVVYEVTQELFHARIANPDAVLPEGYAQLIGLKEGATFLDVWQVISRRV